MNRIILGLAVAAVCSLASISEAAVMVFRGTVNSANSKRGVFGSRTSKR